MSREAGKPLPIETLPRTELEKIQNKRLRYTLRMAYEHTKFWHEKFDNLGMKPEDIKTKEDLIKAAQKGLNMTDEDLVFNYAKLCAKYLDYEGYTILTTSGTSGKGWKQVPYTNSDFSRSNEQVELLFNKMNVRKGSKNLNGYGPPPNALVFW